MKTITSVLVLFIAATHGSANAQQSARSAKLKPVPIQSGAVTLTPANTRIDFVGTHEGPKPDPRKGGFAKFSGKVVVSDNGSLESVAFEHIGRGGEIAGGVEQQRHPLAEVFLAQEKGIGPRFYVSHVDLYALECYGKQPNSVTK